ncbi:hypothetical protein EYF80_027085 [Liparis tanakae]|uniref:Uncharacterized protein n=1 Tax=Liparis tanakae TaxID=230148 RepID=A0A4Z2HCM4_9TELE|nr:hypothetical protein EYF80_027085 [Liparis tanakae]
MCSSWLFWKWRDSGRSSEEGNCGVLSSTSVEVVGAYGVMDIEGSPGELEVLPWRTTEPCSSPSRNGTRSRLK